MHFDSGHENLLCLTCAALARMRSHVEPFDFASPRDPSTGSGRGAGDKLREASLWPHGETPRAKTALRVTTSVLALLPARASINRSVQNQRHRVDSQSRKAHRPFGCAPLPLTGEVRRATCIEAWLCQR